MDLRSGERLIFRGHPSWRLILGFYAKWLLVLIVVGVIVYLVRGTGLTAAAVGVILALALIVGFVKRVSTTYSITNQRLQIRRGIVARHVQETRLDRVQNVSTDQGVIERILQVGTVDFDTAGTDDSDFSFDGVGQPEKVMRAVEEAQHEAAQSQSQQAQGLAGAPAPRPEP